MTDYNIEFKDHKVVNPHRFRQVQVSPGIVDLIPIWIEDPSQIIEEGTAVNADLFDKLRANVTRRSETFTATAGQTVFNLTKSYLVNQGRVDVYVSGVKQRSGIDFMETNPTRITMTQGQVAGTVIEVVYFSASQALSEDLIEQVQAAEAATSAAVTATTAANTAADTARNSAMNWKEPVATLTALNAIQNPQEGDARQVTADQKGYRYDGTAWRVISELNLTPLTEVDNRLTSQLADIETDLTQEIEVVNNDLQTSKSTLQADIYTARNEQVNPARIITNSLSSEKLKISSDSDRIKLINLSDEVLQAMAGNTPVNVTPTANSVTNEKIALGAVTPEVFSFVTQSKNLFNKATAVAGFEVSLTDGTLVAAANYTASDYIRVLPNTTYSRSMSWKMAFYDQNKTFISARDDGRQVTTPTNAAYVRVSFLTSHINNYQFELGGAETAYVPYQVTINDDTNLHFPTAFIDKNFGEIPLKKTDALEPKKNLFDKSKATDGFYVIYTSGILAANATYFATDFIEVVPNQTYTTNYDAQMAFYDQNKSYISGVNGGGFVGNKTVTAPANAKYARFSTKDKETLQIEKGSVATAYEPYQLVLKKSYVPYINDLDSKKELLLFLPPELPIAVGRTIELYNRQVAWTGNIENYHFKWTCAVGNSFKRKWSCTGVTEKIGNHTLTCTVYDNNMVQVAQASTIVKIVDTTLATTKKLLCIGDSLSNKKAWMPELNTLTGGKIQFVGSRPWTSGATTYGHEGRSGFTAGNYLTASTYPFENEGVHPFWNPATSSFDYAYYKAQTGVNPDAIQIFLGTNGIALDPTTNAGNIKTIVDKIRQADATIPIYVVFTLYRGDQNGMGRQLSSDGYSAGSGVWKLEEDRKVYNLMVKLYDLLKSYSNLRFIPIAHTHDSEYNFFNGTTYPVNPRSTITEPQHNEATHPQNPGYFQMADIIYSVWCAYND